MDKRNRPRKGLLFLEIASDIKDLIRENDLRPGDRLPTEGELADRLGVSRSSVREAIKSLQLAGLLAVRPKYGCVLRPFDAEPLSDHLRFQYKAGAVSINDLLEAREVLEMGASEMAIEHADGETLRLMDESLILMERSVPYGPAWTKADMQFHEALMKAAGNRLIDSFVGVLREFFAQVAKSDKAPARDPKQAVDEHRAIRDALLAGDLATARATLRQHLTCYYREIGLTS